MLCTLSEKIVVSYQRSKMLLLGVSLGIMALALTACSSANSSVSSKAPASITIGTLYAGSGPYANSSLSQYKGLQFWVRTENDKGGVYVGIYHRRIPIKLIAYNDQSSATTAASLYTQLITQDHVNILTADWGSALTAPAVPLAQEHHILLFDQTGSSTSFFTASNPYIVFLDDPYNSSQPESLIQYLTAKHMKRVAILYCTNDYDHTIATTTVQALEKAHIIPVYLQGIPTSTSNYATLLSSISHVHPDAVLEFGYPNNDISFLEQVQSNGDHFPFTFTLFPGQEHALLESNVGEKALAYTFSLMFPPTLAYTHVTAGLTTAQFQQAFSKNQHGSVNYLDIAGYNTGVVIQQALKHSKSLSQLALRKAIFSLSGHLTTLDGPFKLNSNGAQIGEQRPLAQLIPTASGSDTKLVAVYPPSAATAKPIYPAP